MSDQHQSLRDDIAFLRGMAEAGRDRPMIGGSILAATGVVFGSASLLAWYFTAVQPMPGWILGAVFLPAFALFIAVLVVLLRALPRSAGSMQAATGVVWSGVGGAIFVINIALLIASDRLNEPGLMFVFPSILLSLYGASWMVAAILLRRPWMHLLGAGAFAMALVSAWVVGQPVMWLVFGLSLLALLGAPGLVLVRQARAAAGHG